ncbi:hypothetical protein JX265_011262 [Neoarthrinium moseri]|uniref:Major facilitator superfamily (MFS) profile domain-containing protein n=1 Tax=Neoarthrinium moseri TaxID=1658444 RepID=A0A9P9WD55_9PEZI|nr:hypothetical protein JX266_007929 [Neoarthrinium moseri]KAI1857527.1 hypothetical protein JX265_011262 [Neoarthrinium moseri]
MNGAEMDTLHHQQNSKHNRSRQRRAKTIDATVPRPLSKLSDDALKHDAAKLSSILELNREDCRQLERAAFLARDAWVWDRIAHDDPEFVRRKMPGGVSLSEREKTALREEQDKLYSEKGIFMVTIAVVCAAFLQGFVQSSINGSSLYAARLGIREEDKSTSDVQGSKVDPQWKLGATNSMPFFSAALLGCWLSIPINDRLGRRGAMMCSAVLVGITSLLAGLIPVMMPDDVEGRWQVLLGVRIVNGIGMGIKAVSTPILASETAIRFWRGSFVLAWQLWVACGIMVGFVFNLIFTRCRDDTQTVALILGAPVVPAAVLFFALWSCPESPRYYLRQEKSNPKRAFGELLRLRSKCELLAFKDMYLLHKSIEEEYMFLRSVGTGTETPPSFLSKFRQLFTVRRLRNALSSSSTVALAQQLCGINVSAFYSGTLFISLLNNNRKPGENPNNPNEINSQRDTIHAMALSLGFGPIPFTLASESFPLSHREIGCAFAIAVNLLFAGLLSILFPVINNDLKPYGMLALFCGLTFVALVMVYLLVEETKELSLEQLHEVFDSDKKQFAKVNARRAWWWIRRFTWPDPHHPKPPVYQRELDVAMSWPPEEVVAEPDHDLDLGGRPSSPGQSSIGTLPSDHPGN